MNNTDAKKINDFGPDQSLMLFFDTLIKKGYLEKECEVIPGLTVKVKSLSTQEILEAESVLGLTGKLPMDIAQKVRGASILSQSIVSINGITVTEKDDDAATVLKKRNNLYRYLLDISPFIISKIFDFYISVALEQEQLYSNPTEVSEKIGNF